MHKGLLFYFVKVIMGVVHVIGQLQAEVNTQFVLFNVISGFGDTQLSVGLTDSFSPCEEGVGTLHSNLDGHKIILPVMGKKFLLEFEDELGNVRAMS